MEDFKTYTLEELSIGKGTYGIAASAVPYDSQKPTYLRITDINDDGTINQAGLMSVDAPNASEFLLKANDLVFARTGNSTGRTYFYEGTESPLVYAGFLIKFSIDEKKVNPRILKYYTHSQTYYNWIKSFDTGVTRGNINAKTYGSMPVCLPVSRKTQDKIVELLSSFDRKIELNRRINDNLEQQAQTLFKAWFIDNAVFGDATVSDYFIPLRGKNFLTSDAKGGKFPVVAGGLMPSAYHNVANTQAPVITISASGANAGYVNLWCIPVWSADSSYIDNTITPYVYFWFNLLKFNQKSIYDSQTGSAQPHIYPKHIGDIRIPDLNINQVAEFDKIVTPIYSQIAKLRKSNAQLAETRDTLLPKLMSEELKINDLIC